MKKRIISVLLTMALICVMLSQTAMHTYAMQLDNIGDVVSRAGIVVPYTNQNPYVISTGKKFGGNSTDNSYSFEGNSQLQKTDEEINTINTLNALLVGIPYCPEHCGSDVSEWTDVAICNAIYGKLLWNEYQYTDSSFLNSIGLEYWTDEDGYCHFDLKLIQKITQDTFGRDFPNFTQFENIFVSGNELLIMPATGESTSLFVQDYVKQGNRIIAVGTAAHNYNDYSEFSGYFQAILEENPSSIYGYTLFSLCRIEGNQNFSKLTASASSELKEATTTYHAGNVLDRNLSTAWVEGVRGVGTNEWIKLETTDGSKMDVSAIEFSLGFQKSNQLLQNNGWPNKVLIECEGGYIQEAEFYSCFNSSVVILDQSQITSWIKITILDAFTGTKYADTCISEIQLRGIDTLAYFQACLEDYPSENDFSSENYARTEWINKHIEYANSDQYKEQVVQGFSGTLDDALEDIKNNGMISAYNTLDSINTILDFDLDLTDVEEYELLLAQILFSRTGTASIDEIYDEFLSNNIITICEILIENIPEMTSSKINENVKKTKILLNTIKGLSRGDTQYNEVLNQIIENISSFGDFEFGKKFADAFDKAGLSFAADFLKSEIDTGKNTLSEVIIYMSAGEAYCNTSDVFGDMILALRKHIAIPSDNPMFEPYQSDEMLVNDQMIWTKLGLKNTGYSIASDPLNTPIYLSNLAKAIENYYTQLEAYKAGNASVIAQNALAEFVEKTADNLVDAELNAVVSLFECLPVVKHFSAIKELFDGTKFVIDTFTSVDDRAYLGTMVMRLYGIAYIHYLSVDNLAIHTDSWGTITTFSPIEQKFDANVQFADAARFDEFVAVYRAILSVATDYAEEYYTTYYETIDRIISKYPNYKPAIPTYIDMDSDTFKSVKQKIIELQMQKNDLAYEWCHSSKIIFDQLNGVNTYDNSELLIYSFKCPVSVIFTNEFGEVIATLSNGNSNVAAGYEHYFFVSEVINESGEFVKIAAVPKSYDVFIEGTGTGRMDVSVSEYIDGQLGETKQSFGIPVSESSRGYFEKNEKDSGDIYLIMDDVTYVEGDYSNTKLKVRNKMTLHFVTVAIAVICVGLVVMILKRKKSNK